MNFKILTLFFCFAVSAAAAITADETLLQVPQRMHDFREKLGYGRFKGSFEELDKKWQYVRFLEQLVREINRDVASGGALSEEEIKAIGLFARLTVILRDDYVPSTFRGASGFEMREVNSMISLHESVLKDLIRGIGKHLSLFRKTEKDWDTNKIAAWAQRFKETTEAESEAKRSKSMH